MAIMLEQLGVAPGHRSIEGTGAGAVYNRALVAVGSTGHVVSPDMIQTGPLACVDPLG